MTDARIIRHNNNIIVLSKSNRPNKKYKAVIQFGDGRVKTVHFGGIKEDGTPYDQYRDDTGLGIYSKYNHLDKDRRNKYYARHGNNPELYSPAWFSHRYLWNKNN